MRVYTYPSEISKENRIVALGLFDGVHLGHRRLIEKARELANKDGLILTVFTFYSEDSLPKGNERIYSTEDKLWLLESLSVDETVLCPFSSVAGLSCDEFVSMLLVSYLNAISVVTGEDFRFGKGAVGDTDTLSSLMKKHLRTSYTVNDLTKDGKKISTADIKEYLKEGNTELAASLLCEPYSICAEVLHGDGRGKGLGIPTINTECIGFSKNLPFGVYETAVTLDGVSYRAITNVGICPTFSVRTPHTETFIPGFSGNLYGKTVKISFIRFIRPEKKFSSPEELYLQISEDINSVGI
jgi:riboflavin kinase/FMN adenylyltransferase